MRVLVTGGAGFIGSNLVEALLAAGEDVTVLDDFSSGYHDNLAAHNNLTVIEGDIRDENALADAVKGQDTIFHLAASVGIKRAIEDPVRDSDINVLGTVRLLRAAQRAGVHTMVASSSAAVYGELQTLPIGEDHPIAPQTPYASSKLGMETQALAAHYLTEMKVVCLRYFNVYGQRQRYDAYGNVIPIFAERMLKGEPITIFGDGEQTRDFVHVDDVVAANLCAASAHGVSGAFNIASGTEVTVNRLTALMDGAFGAKTRKVSGPERRGDVKYSRADISKARAALGYSPRVTLEDGVRRYFDWLGEHTAPVAPPDPAPQRQEAFA